MVYVYVYLVIGLVYALWVWLFQGATIFSIPVNTVFGPFYILAVLWHFLTWEKKTVHSVFRGKKAVIFDLDGTILDDQPAWNDAIENVKTQMGIEVERNYPSGLNVTEKWRRLLAASEKKLPYTAEDLAQKTVDEFLRIYTEVEPRAGFWELVAYLKQHGFKVGLASNSDRKVVDELLSRFDGAPVFDFILAADQVKQHKPHPEIYLTTMKALGVSAHETVAFEDSLTGAESSIAAKIPTILIWDGEISKVLYPQGSLFFLEDFDGIADMIEKSPREQILEAAKESDDGE